MTTHSVFAPATGEIVADTAALLATTADLRAALAEATELTARLTALRLQLQDQIAALPDAHRAPIVALARALADTRNEFAALKARIEAGAVALQTSAKAEARDGWNVEYSRGRRSATVSDVEALAKIFPEMSARLLAIIKPGRPSARLVWNRAGQGRAQADVPVVAATPEPAALVAAALEGG